MSSIGFDFGTTYSVIAALRDAGPEGSVPQAVMLRSQDTSPFYDSIALRKPGGALCYARAARSLIGQPGTVAYKGFKMLLSEGDGETLRRHGYDGETTPAAIVKGYLRYLLTGYQKRFGEIDRLVMGIPESWLKKEQGGAPFYNKARCREELLDILKGLGLAKEVLLVSEPVCACAYYAERYRRLNGGEIFQGHVLVVDYGGGTLDIALCRVEKDPKGRPKVLPIRRSGAGGNERGVIGDAGLAFMERAVCLALEAGGVTREELEDARRKGTLYRCVYQLEEALKEYGARGEDDDNDDEDHRYFYEVLEGKSLRQAARVNAVFINVELSAWCCPVTYGMLASAFQAVIEPVLGEQLDVVLRYMEENGIDYSVGAENFKVQLIGGFCNFCLVEKTVREKLNRSTDGRRDPRYIGEFAGPDERTMAVAYGASLRANGLITDGLFAQYTITMPIVMASNKERQTLRAVERGREIAADRVYLFKYENGNAAVIHTHAISEIQVESDDYGKEWLPFDRQYAQRLQMPSGNYIIGISFDRSEIVTFHWWEVKNTGQLRGTLASLEDRLAAGEKPECLGEEQGERCTSLFGLVGDRPLARQLKSEEG